ncbi:unnamed protein product [Somion occarium]|uniref:Uncharacterized protein n=1 Tax=Somion occarium TaxID=3059160 RepID=A0ABP1E3X8_9APHY
MAPTGDYMALSAPLIIDQGETPYAYEHPYLITTSYRESDIYVHRPIERKEISVWSVSDASTPPSYISTLQGEPPYFPKPQVFRHRFILIIALNENVHTLLLHKIEDGSLCDTKLIVHSKPEDQEHPPIPRDSGFIGVANGLIAILKLGPTGRGKDCIVQVYGTSEEGKFLLKNELQLFASGPLIDSWSPSSLYVPNLIHLTEDTFIGSINLDSNHDVHLLRWSSLSRQLPGHARFPSVVETSEEDEDDWASWLKDQLYIPSSNTLIMVHEEALVADECFPHTPIRSVNVDTFEFNWCIPFELDVFNVRYDEDLNTVIMFGHDRDTFIIAAIDASTGAIRRQVKTDVWINSLHANITCVGELVTSHLDGEVIIMKLSDFIEHGYPASSSSFEYSQAQDDHIVLRIPPFDPASASDDQNATANEGHAEDKQTKRKGGFRAHFGKKGDVKDWVDAAFFGDDRLVLRDVEGLRYAIVGWR